MNKAFKESMSEKDYQVVMGLSKMVCSILYRRIKRILTVFLSTLLIRLERWREEKQMKMRLKSVQSPGWDVN